MGLRIICFLLLLIAVVTLASRDRNKKPYKVVCYLGSWANYRTGDGKYTIGNIDPQLCTHLIYGFAKLENNRIAPFDAWLDLKDNGGLGSYEKFNNLRKQNAQLTTLIAIGGWSEGSQKYSRMVSNSASRSEFVRSAVDFLRKHNFDGLDLDWEYPANRGGAPQDKQNFIHLLKELKNAFKPHGFVLSAAVSAGKGTIDSAYNIGEMNKYLDFINVMTYDMHGSWEKQTGHNAPLYAQWNGDVLNVDSTIKYWIQKGADRKKLVLGMGTYGRSFTLANAGSNGLGAPASGPGAAGPITKSQGMLGYNEICLNLKQGWTEKFPGKVEAPYAFKGNQWVGYDNVRSIGAKVDYLKREKLGGGMIWSLETDDFRGKCGKKYALLSTIKTKLNG